jgi:hypothetical protein
VCVCSWDLTNASIGANAPAASLLRRSSFSFSLSLFVLCISLCHSDT